ncbi:MAG: FAD-dependent oxidoreductase [Spirochaetes bacterium]|nr:FAD-dependent oxidoreductase [Spirochaetota bacterium]
MPAPGWFRIVFYFSWSFVWLLITVILFISAAWKAPVRPFIEYPAIGLAALCFLLPVLPYARRLLAKPIALARAFFSGYLRPALFLAALVAVFFILKPAKYPTPQPTGGKIAVIGAGSAGAHAAWLLHQNKADFRVFEATDYIGGHALGFDFPSAGKKYPVDLGFIFGAPSSYKEFKTLLALNGIERTMSRLTYYTKVKDTEWATEAKETITEEVERFHRLADRDYNDPSLNLVPFGWWLKKHGFSDKFRETHLTPMLIVLFVSSEGFYEQSTRFILNMYAGPGKWVDYRRGYGSWVVKGSSKEYYARLTAPFRDKIQLFAPVTRVERKNGKVIVTWTDTLSQTRSEEFDGAIITAPADVARKIVVTEWWEDWTLAQVRYTPVIVDLHSDTSILPEPKMRRAFNFFQSGDTETFELIGRSAEIFGYGKLDPEPLIHLNPQRRAKDPLVSRVWRHHAQDLWHIAVMDQLLTKMQGRGNIYYAGDWVKFIGHGFAMRTGMNAACHLTGVKKAGEIRRMPEFDHCQKVTVVDAREPEDKEQSIQICNNTDAYRYITAIACADMLPEKERIAE